MSALLPRTALLRVSSRRYLVRHPWQLALSIAGVAVGVAVVVAIQLANASASRAFTLATEAVAGKATHQIVGGPAGLANEVYRRLRLEAPEIPAAPVVEGWASTLGDAGTSHPTAPRRPLRLLGVESLAEGPFRSFSRTLLRGGQTDDLAAFLTRPGAVLLAAETARELGLARGQRFELLVAGRHVELVLAGTLDAGEEAARRATADLVLMDLATAQEALRLTTLSRIDLVVPEDSGHGGLGREGRLAQITRLLPADASLRPAAARTRTVEEMTRAFRLNLSALALLALLCGTFLIYNSMTFSVVQRRTWIGTLRALGVTRGEVLRLVLGEAAWVGAVGTALGLVLGVVLARGLVRLVARTLNDLYFAVEVRSVAIAPGVLVAGALLGLAATVLAALPPALEATFTPPRAVLARSTLEERHRRGVPRAAALGAGLIALGGLLLAWPSARLPPAFAGLLGVILGCALLAPAGTVGMVALLRPLLGRGLGWLGRMAAGGVTGSLSRTAVAISALMIAVSVTSGVGIMIASFRDTVVRWLEATLAADLYLIPPGRPATSAPLDEALLAKLAAVPGVARINSILAVTVAAAPRPGEIGGPGETAAEGRVLARVFDLDARGRATFDLREGDARTAWPRLDSGEAVLVSEPFAYRRGLHAGSPLRLRTPAGERDFAVAGVFYDYGTDQGAILFTRQGYQRHWPAAGYSAFAVFATPGTRIDGLEKRLRAVAGAAGQELEIRSNRVLREGSLVIFDRTFTITQVLRLLAGIVAFAGVLAALTALALEKAREIGVLRANGVTPREVWRLVTTETALLGLIAGVLSIPVGLAMAAIMIYVINRRSFGWTIHLRVEPAMILQALALALGAALLAGLYPAWKMSRTSPAVALREE